jgi:hypothetical protein
MADQLFPYLGLPKLAIHGLIIGLIAFLFPPGCAWTGGRIRTIPKTCASRGAPISCSFRAWSAGRKLPVLDLCPGSATVLDVLQDTQQRFLEFEIGN